MYNKESILYTTVHFYLFIHTKMNKNLLKMGALALGMFAFGVTLMGTSNAATGEVSLTINSGTSVCEYGKDLVFTAQDVKLGEAYLFQSPFLTGVGGTNTWSCVDRTANGAWSFSVSASDLVLNGNSSITISSGNIAIQYGSGNIEGDSDCTILDSNKWNALSGSIVMMERTYNTKGVCKVTVNNVELKVDVPANQTPGTYTSTFTVTLPNF